MKYFFLVLVIINSFKVEGQSSDSAVKEKTMLSDDGCGISKSYVLNHQLVDKYEDFYPNGKLKSLTYLKFNNKGQPRKRDSTIIWFEDDRCFNCSYSKHVPLGVSIYARDFKYEWYDIGSVKCTYRLVNKDDTTKMQEINLNRGGDTVSIKTYSYTILYWGNNNENIRIGWNLDGVSRFWELEDKLYLEKIYDKGKLRSENIFNHLKEKITTIQFPNN